MVAHSGSGSRCAKVHVAEQAVSGFVRGLEYGGCQSVLRRPTWYRWQLLAPIDGETRGVVAGKRGEQARRRGEGQSQRIRRISLVSISLTALVEQGSIEPPVLLFHRYQACST